MTTLPRGVYPVMITPFDATGAIDFSGVDALVEWYLDAGAAGLFAVSQSSEMFHLTPDERVALAKRVVARVGGRVPVVATGGLEGSIEEQAASIRRIAATGAAAVIVTASGLAGAEADAPEWRAAMERLLERTGSIPLGLYECPAPYHRRLSAETLGWAAATGRFLFHKDTSCAIEPIRAKLEAIRGTPLRFYNAHSPTLLESLQAGGAGYSGIGANFCPELYVRLCRESRSDPDAAELEAFLIRMDAEIFKYPSSAKRFAALRGVPILPRSRARNETFTDEEARALEDLRERIDHLHSER